MRVFQVGMAAALLALPLSGNAESRRLVTPATLSYADLADLAVAAPLAAHVRVKRAVALKNEQAAGVPTGHTRYYVEASVVSLLRGSAAGMPGEVSFLADVAGEAARIRGKSEYILFAHPVPGKPGELRLAARDALVPASPQVAERVRKLLREAVAADAAPRITGIGKAFHVPGSLAGESETQIFLQAEDGRPVSLNVLRRPGAEPQWAVALGDIVDEAAAAPAPNTLLWYRLACTLPAALPAQSLEDADEAAAASIRADYRLIKERLGPCTRTRSRR